MRAIAFALLLALLPAMQAEASPLKLNSGKTVQILSVGPVFFSASKPALILRYQTTLPPDDVEGMRKEADEIWQFFVADVERAKYDAALVQANTPPTGVIIKTNKSYGFVFKKVDGLWRTTESGITATTKLSEAMLRSFYRRWDWLIEHYDERALGLYLDKAWRIKVEGLPNGPQEMDATAYLADIAAGRNQGTMLEHRRDVLNIKIDPKTNTAVVECRETGRRKLNDGRQLLGVERTTEVIALRGEYLVLTKTSDQVEKFETTPAP